MAKKVVPPSKPVSKNAIVPKGMQPQMKSGGKMSNKKGKC